MSTTKIASKKLLTVAPLAAITAAAVNAALFFIGKATGLISDSVLIQPANQPMSLIPVLISSILPTLLAGGVLALLNRFASAPLRIFNIIAAVLLVLSFISPFASIPNVPIGMSIWLNVMHVVVAGAVVFAFNRFTAVE
jgi:glucan phosphoethanolaminetransferase (alkaline phosphatase superfamily)